MLGEEFIHFKMPKASTILCDFIHHDESILDNKKRKVDIENQTYGHFAVLGIVLKCCLEISTNFNSSKQVGNYQNSVMVQIIT